VTTSIKYVEWHLKQSLAPLLFEDEEIDDSSLNVIKANRSGSSGFCVETRSILIEYPQNSPKSFAQ
jgi:hypothetical protein